MSSPEEDDIEPNFEQVIFHPGGTETVIDPLVGTYDQSINPWSSPVPAVFEVEVQIQIGVTSRIRHDDEQWRKTDTYTNPFYLTTSTFTYGDDTGAFAQDVWDFAQSEIQRGAQISLHSAVWLDNPSHPPEATGVIRLPKGHRDSAYTQAEFVSSGWLQERLNNICSDLKNTARY